ncbi:thioredoxin-like protein [Aspergillus granulosus]|uniref:Thioredoxin-like protein n=1 Tax=Aspergillus granulosus TaxID=176169 RepID=A0ABR4HGW6_9EURO
MALAPKFSGQKLPAPPTTHGQQHTLELYLDYVCPFSAKLFKTFYASVRPLISEKYHSILRVIFRQHIQPWHPSSTLAHEAGAAVLRIAPDKFWEFSAALFEHQQEFFDVNVVNEARNQTYERLANIGSSVGVNKDELLDLLTVADKPDAEGQLNTGNKVTNDIKLMVKAGRVVGVHVSPTVYFNGIEEPGISSSFTATQWEQWLAKNVK